MDTYYVTMLQMRLESWRYEGDGMKPKNHFDPEANFNDVEKVLDRFDPAWAKAALFLRDTSLHFGHNGEIRSRGLIAIRELLETRRRRYEAGSTIELLHAIALCAAENLPLPTWLALAFKERFNSFGCVGGATSLDGVFYSKAASKRTPRKAFDAQYDWQTGSELWSAVWEVALRKDAQHTSLDTAIDEVLKTRKNWGVKKTKAKALVTMVDKQQTELVGGQPLSQFFAIRRKRVT